MKDALRPEYSREDFKSLERGRYARRIATEAVLVALEPDVAKAFPTAQAVNDALRGVIKAGVATASGGQRPGKRAASGSK